MGSKSSNEFLIGFSLIFFLVLRHTEVLIGSLTYSKRKRTLQHFWTLLHLKIKTKEEGLLKKWVSIRFPKSGFLGFLFKECKRERTELSSLKIIFYFLSLSLLFLEAADLEY